MYEIEASSEEELRRKIKDHFMNTLKIDCDAVVQTVLSTSRDNMVEDTNKR